MSNNNERNRNLNINSRSRRNHRLRLSHSERILLETYTNMYNSTLRRIDFLYENLNEIRNNIDFIVGINNNEEYGEDNNNIRRNDIYTENIVPNQNNVSEYFRNERQPSRFNRMTNYANLNPNNHSSNARTNSLHSNNLTDVVNLLVNYISPNSSIPTSNEIVNATRLLTYHEIENPINDRCPISHELFQPHDGVIQINYCGHIFHTEQINTWFQRNSNCPVCRYNIINNNGFSTSQDNLANDSNNNYPTFNSNVVNGIVSNSHVSNTSSTNTDATNVNAEVGSLPLSLNSRISDIFNNAGYDISNNYILFESFYRNI